ncbi:MAG: hypothetical protein Fur007_13520 [Rhodoferax sp.]
MPVNPTLWIEPAAPPKPALGAECNGCGVCCLLEPCPVGVVLSGRRTGACTALRWDGAQARYRCGVLTDAPAVLAARWPRAPGVLRAGLARAAQAWGPRWIAAGQGCDCDVEAQPTHFHTGPQ